MRFFQTGDLVLLINSTYNPDIIGSTGTVAHGENLFEGFDKFGQLVSGVFVVVELPDFINRHGANLWYLKPQHLIKLKPFKESDPRQSHRQCDGLPHDKKGMPL